MDAMNDLEQFGNAITGGPALPPPLDPPVNGGRVPYIPAANGGRGLPPVHGGTEGGASRSREAINSPFLSRRRFLECAACGFGSIALQAMLADVARAAASPLASRGPHF